MDEELREIRRQLADHERKLDALLKTLLAQIEHQIDMENTIVELTHHAVPDAVIIPRNASLN